MELTGKENLQRWDGNYSHTLPQWDLSLLPVLCSRDKRSLVVSRPGEAPCTCKRQPSLLQILKKLKEKVNNQVAMRRSLSPFRYSGKYLLRDHNPKVTFT